MIEIDAGVFETANSALVFLLVVLAYAYGLGLAHEADLEG